MKMDVYYKECGKGISVFFLHGLGSNLSQAQQLLSTLRGIRLITMDCRGHGKTPFTGAEDISFSRYADDVVAFADKLNIKKAVFGGISMGAGIAMNVAVRYPERLKGLILLRPAWLDKKNPPNLHIFRVLANLLLEKKGKTIVDTPEYKEIEKTAPAAAKSIVQLLDREQKEHTAEIFLRMVGDAPIAALDELKNIKVPCIVLGNQQDPLHPLEYAKTIASCIPGAVYAEVASRYVDEKLHKKEVESKIKYFINKNLIF